MTQNMILTALNVLLVFLVPFVIFTAIGLICAGRRAVEWSGGLLASVRTNLFLLVANSLIAPVIFIGVVLVDSGYEALGLPQTPLQFWDQMPLWVVIVAWLISIDFMDYWIHRLLHKPGFWAVHAVHHSDEEMNWTTTKRIHVLEVVVMKIGYIVMASWMNIPGESIGAIAALRVMHNHWVHTRYDVHLGPLSKFIATPRFHHWHHADDPAAYNTNFANTFSFWDVLFGTYRVPSSYGGKFGFEGSPGNDVIKLLIWPYLQWLDVFREKEQRRNKLLTPSSVVDR